jgi:hypothetical protein
VNEHENRLAQAFTAAAERHAAEPDVFHLCGLFGEQSQEHMSRLRPFADDAIADGPGPQEDGEADGSLLDDLTRLFVLTQECWVDATAVRQAALAKRDEKLLAVVDACLEETAAQAKWLTTRIKTTAPQWLTVE